MAFLKFFQLHSPLYVLPTAHASVQLLWKLRCEHVGGQSSTFPVWQSACVTSTNPFMQSEHKHGALAYPSAAEFLRCYQIWVSNFTSVCADIFGARLAVAALSLQHLPLTFPPTVFWGRSRTHSVPLPDSASTASVTLWPLRPLWPATVNCMTKTCKWGWAHCAATEPKFLKNSWNHLDTLEGNTLDCQTELHHRNRQA